MMNRVSQDRFPGIKLPRVGGLGFKPCKLSQEGLVEISLPKVSSVPVKRCRVNQGGFAGIKLLTAGFAWQGICFRVPNILLVTLLLASCANFGGAPSHHTVQKGDTLYSICFRHNLDYKQIASINGIAPPYTIYPGQRLKLNGSSWFTSQDAAPEGGAESSRQPVQQTAEQRELAEKVASLPTGVPEFRWPIQGKVVRGFSLRKNPVNQGVDIAAGQGEPVLAAADGVVVYVGSNLRKYGKLVILKHNKNFISAYANNASTRVKEGQLVKSGKTIGKVGVNTSGESFLHFEIRRNGKPVNPLAWLPKVSSSSGR